MLAADIYQVTTLDDVAVAGTTGDALWSLREAISHSASDGTHAGEVDTIQFDSSLFANGSKTLLLGDEDGDGQVTSPAETASQLIIQSALTIEGPGTELLTISGGGAVRVMNVSTSGTLTLTDATIADGYTPGDGAGIYIRGDTTLERVAMRNNWAIGSAINVGSHGGALYAKNAEVNIVESTLDDNHAAFGAAIYYKPDYGERLIVEGSTVSNNVGLTAFGAGNQSAITVVSWLASSGGIDIFNSTISNNVSNRVGGIYLRGKSDALIVNSTIVENQALWNSFTGGIAHYDSTTVELHNSIVAHNVDGQGTNIDI